jgi:hypothetical protein
MSASARASPPLANTNAHTIAAEKPSALRNPGRGPAAIERATINPMTPPTTKPSNASATTKYPDSPSRLETLYQSTTIAATTPAPSMPSNAVSNALAKDLGHDMPTNIETLAHLCKRSR